MQCGKCALDGVFCWGQGFVRLRHPLELRRLMSCGKRFVWLNLDGGLTPWEMGGLLWALLKSSRSW